MKSEFICQTLVCTLAFTPGHAIHNSCWRRIELKLRRMIWVVFHRVFRFFILQNRVPSSLCKMFLKSAPSTVQGFQNYFLYFNFPFLWKPRSGFYTGELTSASLSKASFFCAKGLSPSQQNTVWQTHSLSALPQVRHKLFHVACASRSPSCSLAQVASETTVLMVTTTLFSIDFIVF